MRRDARAGQRPLFRGWAPPPRGGRSWSVYVCLLVALGLERKNAWRSAVAFTTAANSRYDQVFKTSYSLRNRRYLHCK